VAAKPFGLEVVYRGQISLGQPDFTAECLAARNAGAEMMILAADANTMTRVARSCAAAGYKPGYMSPHSVTDDVRKDPALNGLVVESPMRPWFTTDSPALVELHKAMAKDAPGVVRRQNLAEFFGLLRERDMISFSLFYAVTFGGFVGFASFLSILLGDQYGLTKVHAGELAALGVMSGSLVRPLGGLLADRLGGIRMLNVLFGVVALLAMGVAQLPALPIAVGLFVVAMACLGLGNGSVFQLMPHRYGERVGVATGILGAAGSLGGFFLPTLLGWLKQSTGTYSSGLSALAALAVVALIVLAVVQSEWVGVWIDKHGRVQLRPAVAPILDTTTV